MNAMLKFNKIFVFFFAIRGCIGAKKSRDCDDKLNDQFQEGNIGESGSFRWLGILRVHIRMFLYNEVLRLPADEGSKLKIALTGLVLVTEKYAVANAADIENVAQNVLREDSKAMFIAEDGNPWYCAPKGHVTHPEYGYSTYVTIALLELDMNDSVESSLKPICWPGYSFNTSNHLYALGYTDEHQLLEKVIYKLQYINRSLCDEFYNRGQFESRFNVPVYYECGFAVNNKKNCVWDNGMVLASNSTGRWTLIGFGIRGPGCAGPARFIDMYHYLPWIESTTSVIEESYNYNA